MNLKINLPQKIGRGYATFWNFKGRYKLVKGGRGSKKSTTTAQWLIYNMMKYPLANSLVIRQTFNTHRDSTLSQLQWATYQLGVSHLWKTTVSPMEMTYIPTGQKILFRGLDNPMSITSITVQKGVLCWVWFEEAYQIKSEDDFNKVDMSIRGEMPEGYFKQIILTFNPWSEKHWIKRRFFDTPNDENKLALTTNYLCNEWLKDDYWIYDQMKIKQPERYRIEGLGEWGVSEGLVFTNWKVEDFNLVDVRDYALYVGLDFGWRDPTAIFCARVDEENKRMYVIQEYYKSERTLDEVANWLKENGYQHCQIMCDSAEPRSIEDLQNKGIYLATPAKKGAGSIMEGIRALQEYEIIVHPICVNLDIELSNYCWEKNKEGLMVDKPIDDFCHLLDAARYSLGCKRDKIKVASKSSWGF